MILSASNRQLNLDSPRIMGVLNITPDSFSDGGKLLNQDGSVQIDKVQRTAQHMIDAGADILDIGGESTRPGAQTVTIAEECDRVMPVLEQILELDTIVSVDTSKPEVAQAAVAMGCHMINDVKGIASDQMLDVVAAADVAVCMMHMQGEPSTMQKNPEYQDVVVEVKQFFSQQVERCLQAGIEVNRLVVDPGFGFGKTLEHNMTMLRCLDELRRLEEIEVMQLPILVGLSRKSTIGKITGQDVDSRLAGSLAAAVLAVINGANIVRVHDVAETKDALSVVSAARCPT